MTTIKCKMCGGTMEIADNSTVAVCEYCGIQQTIPKLSDDRKANLYDRANHFRRSNEFDKAQAIYEQILNEDPNDAESYWSLVLCKYGIEYVEDPATHKRVPTVNRTQFTSIFEDPNYKEAIRLADHEQREIYEEEAKTINNIQKGILEISKQEDPFDVFICYKESDDNGKRTRDSVLAQELYYELKKAGFKVFFARITLESKLGTAYEPYIFSALNSSKVMVVIGTKPEYFKAVWVRNEWSRFLEMIKRGEKKTLIPAYRDMDPYDLPEEFSFLQAQDMSKLGFMQDLVTGIKKLVDGATKTVSSSDQSKADAQPKNKNPLLKRAGLFLEENDFDNASEYIKRALDTDPENPEAYYLSFLCKNKRSDLSKYTNLSSFSNDKDILYAYRFSDASFKDFLDKQKESIQTNKQYLDKLLQSYDYVRSGGGAFATELQDVEDRIREANVQKQKCAGLKLEISRLSSDSSEKRASLDELRKKQHEKENQLARCGAFAFKEKKEIKEELSSLAYKISELESELESNNKDQITAEQTIKSLPDENSLEDRIEKLEKEKEVWEQEKKEAEKKILFDGDLNKLEKSIDGFYDCCYQIGDMGPAGGFVFYDKGTLSDGWRFLESAPADIILKNGVPMIDSCILRDTDTSNEPEFRFGFYRKSPDGKDLYVNGSEEYNMDNCTGTAIGTGKRNTELLVKAMGESAYESSSDSFSDKNKKTSAYAAKLCFDLVYNGFNDWFLPSRDELNLMYENLHKAGLGGFSNNIYWSSSERDKSYDRRAWGQFFHDGNHPNYHFYLCRVRPVRAF